MRIARSCVFAFNSNMDLVARPPLAEAERFFGGRITSGGEREIHVAEARRLHSAFEWEEVRMGGQAGNMANAAAALGVRCLAHAYNLSPGQRKLFPKGVEVSGRRTKAESRHYVLELVLRNGRRDRLIASHDPAHAELRIARDFASRSTGFISAGCGRAVASGFHILNCDDAAGRLKAAARLMRRWKAANPALRIHFEAGDFARKAVLLDVVKTILPLVDSIGMNEKELCEFAAAFGIRERHGFEAARLLAEEIPEVVVHTADYAFAYSRIRPVRTLESALRLGHALSAHRAMTGGYAGLPDAENMIARKHPECRAGCGAAEEFVEAGFGRHGVLVPSFEIRPKLTVGLGDSFAAGCFLVE